MLRHALEAQGYAVIEARDETEARTALGQSLPSVVLSDLRLPAGDGFGVLRAAKDADPDLPVIVMTAYGSIQDAVAAMKDGALDFLAKPVDPDHLLLLVERALAQRRLLSEYNLLKEEAAKRRGMPAIIGESAALRHTMQSVQRAAGSDTTVLLEGESGTGKELFARALHALSERCERPVHRHQLRRHPRHAARGRAVRLREGRLHRGGAAQARPLRAGAARHAVPRRSGRAAARPPGQAAARDRDEAVRAARRHLDHPGRRAARRRDQSRPSTGRGGPAVPRRPLLPPLGVSGDDSAAARAAARTSRCWRGTSWSARAASWAARP